MVINHETPSCKIRHGTHSALLARKKNITAEKQVIFVLKQEANIISDINIIYVHPDLSCYLQHKMNKLA